jgi:hypothetical protein
MINDDPYFGVNISSLYHDSTSLANLCITVKSSVILSINIQSLMSKHANLVLELAEFEKKGIIIDAIAI